jgi:small conductance mechanosensitive channel
MVLLPLLAGVLAVYHYREQLFGRHWDLAVRLMTTAALISLGWQFARDIGRAFGPTLLRRMVPAPRGPSGSPYA